MTTPIKYAALFIACVVVVAFSLRPMELTGETRLESAGSVAPARKSSAGPAKRTSSGVVRPNRTGAAAGRTSRGPAQPEPGGW